MTDDPISEMPATEPSLILFHDVDPRQLAIAAGAELYLALPRAPAVPWLLPRRLLPALRHVAGESAVNAALAPHRALLSLVLRDLEPRLSAAERSARSEHSALCLGRLPAVKLHSGPLRHAWAEALAELLRGRRIVLLIPDLATLDLQSLLLIRPLLGRADDALRLVIGARDESPSEDLDLLERLGASVRRRELRRLQTLPCSRTVEPDGEPTLGAGAWCRLDASDELDDDLEARAWPPSGSDDDTLRAAVDAAFGGYGFDTSLRFAGVLLGRESDPAGRRELHWHAALSGYNLLSSRDDWPVAGPPIAEHLQAALDLETDAAGKALAHYLLSIVSSRMIGDVGAGLRHGEAAVRGARDPRIEPGLRHYLEAWARNVYAYSLFRRGRQARAIAQCERAVALLADAPEHPAVPPVQIDTTRWHLFDNLAKASAAIGDGESAVAWQRRRNRLAGDLPLTRRPALNWLLPDVGHPDLRADTAALEQQMRRAATDLDLHAEAFCAHALALQYFRTGDAERAHRLFGRALRLWQTLDADAEDRLTGELNCAVTAFRAGVFDDAGRRFERLRADPAIAGSEAETELLAASAMVAAAAGDPHAAGRLALRSRRRLRAHEDAEVHVRVLRSLAEVALLLGDGDAARRELNAAGDRIAGSGEPLPAEDVLGVRAAELACGLAGHDAVEQAILLVPAALEDANAWWDLARLVPAALAGIEAGELDRDDPELGRALRSLATAANQRADCQPTAGTLATYTG